MSYDQRFYGEVTSRADLSDFPFDRRALAFELAAVDHTAEDVAFVLSPGRTGRRAELSVANWDVGPQQFTLHSFPLLEHHTFAGAIVSYEARRKPLYYVSNAILPLVLVVFMSWCVFWVNPAYLAPQIGLSATSMLALIAYRFTLGRVLPPVSYFTRMDAFLIAASVLVFLALVEAVVTSSLTDHGRDALALRIDRGARWSFPVAFAFATLWAFVI